MGSFSGAFAQSGDSRGLYLLSRATRSFDAGAYSDASSLIDAAFRAGLNGELAARAILLRARINERSRSYARALQDYSNALWMESLPAADRKTATEGKERVMAAMGLAPQQQQQASALPQSQAVQERSRQAGAPQPSPYYAQQQAPASSGGIGGFFDSIFGGGSSGGQQAAQAQPQQRGWQASAASQSAASAVVMSPAATRRAAPIRVDPSLQADAPVRPPRVAKSPPAPTVRTSAVTPVSTSASAVVAPADGFLIVFGSSPSQQSGLATARQIKAQLSDILVNRNLDVERGSGGYRIQAGPYKAKTAATALCRAITQRGISCTVTP
ncbi:SPOR domain-containing protein [Rhodomicrobium sp. Az07]|uniref:SPOR domain-containing protein n=1 Tax=Rhodomicrobium sp. Az07 TaxID=2839034 RepID=UPI001BEB4C2F|nr:SPOR domain-containing protein [Rhodomicrobium sp. Az07]MBT3069791.1 SPOR domain-containing protein [Rhodomicrobium sp. Az07]